MTKVPFESFIDLVRFDQEVKAKEKQMVKERAELEQLLAQQQAFQDEVAVLKQAIRDTQKEVDAKELDMKTLDQRMKEIKQKLDETANAKEYMALKKEFETVTEKQLALEDTLVKSWQQLETAERSMEQKKSAISEQGQKAVQEVEQKKGAISQVETALSQLKDERAGKVQAIPAEWIEKYEVMRQRVDDPVVEVVQGSCGGCFYTITDQELLQLKRRALLQCKSCYRFLYDPAVLGQTEEPSADESEQE